jgi:ApaG protein
MPPAAAFFYRQTEGIRVTVRPVFLRSESFPSHGQFVFAYFVRIENVGDDGVQLLSRRWLIRDAAGEDTEVVGDGVVGEQPVIAPGQVHEYQSFCVLKSPSGSMAGHYQFLRPDGTRCNAAFPRFELNAEA